MNKVEEMLQHIRKQKMVTKEKILYESIQSKLQNSLIVYYNDLQKKLNSIYEQLIEGYELSALKQINTELLKK